jgi:Pretoxin HINT domain
VAGTLVTSDHGLVPIEQVESGDGVQARDLELKAIFVQKVTGVVHGRAAETVQLDFGPETIECTPAHRFYTGAWTNAGMLRPGHRVLRSDGCWQELIGVRRKSEPQPVFNLEVQGLHNYLVGRSGLVVHNIKVVTRDPKKQKESSGGRAKSAKRQPFAPKAKKG